MDGISDLDVLLIFGNLRGVAWTESLTWTSNLRGGGMSGISDLGVLLIFGNLRGWWVAWAEIPPMPPQMTPPVLAMRRFKVLCTRVHMLTHML